MGSSTMVSGLKEQSPRGTSGWGTACSISLIVVAAIAAYSNSFQGQFVFDDDLSIVENQSIRSLVPIWPVLFDATSATVVGRPLLNLSLAVNYAVGGLDVRGYHAVNLALHILAALALFGVVRRTLSLPTTSPGLAQDATPLALATSLVWLLHPLQTESVTYIVQRAESLVALFYLWTLYCLIRGATSGKSPSVWYVAATLSCFLGMASKEVMVSVPLIAFLYDRIFLVGSFREIFRLRGILYGALASSWAFLALLMVSSGGRHGTAGFGRGMSSWDYAMTQFGAIVGYLQLSFFPDPLVLDYGDFVARTPGEIVPYALVILALLVATCWLLRYHPQIGFVGLSFFALLAPTSSIVPLVTQTIAEHRMYLPLAAVMLLTVLGGWAGWNSILWGLTGTARHGTLSRWGLPSVLLAGVCLTLGYQTYLRNADYRSVLTLAEDNARKRPGNPRAYYTIAAELIKRKDFRGAIQNCDRAIAVDPECVPAYLNRGNAFAFSNDLARALEDYARVLAISPDYSPANYKRGLIYAHGGRTQEALQEFSRAIELNPNYAAALYERGMLFQKLGQYSDAISDFTRAIELEPSQPELFRLRSQCYYATRQFDLARQDVRSMEQHGGRPDPEFVKLLSEEMPAEK